MDNANSIYDSAEIWKISLYESNDYDPLGRSVRRHTGHSRASADRGLERPTSFRGIGLGR